MAPWLVPLFPQLLTRFMAEAAVSGDEKAFDTITSLLMNNVEYTKIKNVTDSLLEHRMLGSYLRIVSQLPEDLVARELEARDISELCLADALASFREDGPAGALPGQVLQHVARTRTCLQLLERITANSTLNSLLNPASTARLLATYGANLELYRALADYDFARYLRAINAALDSLEQ